MAEDIAQFAQDRALNEVPFTEIAVQDFESLWHDSLSTYRMSLQALETKDHELAKRCVRWRANLTPLIWLPDSVILTVWKWELVKPEQM